MESPTHHSKAQVGLTMVDQGYQGMGLARQMKYWAVQKSRSTDLASIETLTLKKDRMWYIN